MLHSFTARTHAHKGRKCQYTDTHNELKRDESEPGDGVGRSGLALLPHAVVASYGAVSGFSLNGLAIGAHQQRGHQAQRAKAWQRNDQKHIR
jgi:hypothetical protein